MADQKNNANSDDTAAQKGGGASPWDDELDLPPEKAEESKPQLIIGSLDPGSKPEEKPVPFNVPEEVIEEKVSKQLSAEKIMGKDKPISYQPIAAEKPQSLPPSEPATPQPTQAKDTSSVLKTEEDASTEPPKMESASASEKQEGVSALLLDKPTSATPPKPLVDGINKPTQEPATPQPSIDIPRNATPMDKSVPEPAAPDQADIPAKPEDKKVSKSGGFHLFGKSTPVKPADKVESKQPAESNPALSPAKLESPQKKPASPVTPSLSKVARPSKLAWIFAVFVLLTASIYLTEIGLISFGLEKIYGIVGLEKLWGGLPRSAEPALAQMLDAQKESLNFKFNGKITATVDKTKESPVTSPIVVYGSPLMALADISVASRDNAVTAQYDYYEEDYDSGDSGLGTNTPYESESGMWQEDYTDGESEIMDMEIDTLGEDQSSLNSYSGEEVTVKQLDFEVSGQSADNGISSTFDLKPIVGSTKRLEIASARGNLYVKSNDFKFDEKAESGKWLSYSYDGFSSENILADLFNIKLDTGFSAKGIRVGNDKLPSGRAYHYQIYNIEMGDAFAAYGVPGSVADAIKADVWIGVRDHLLKKIILDITPSISSSLTNLKCEIDFSEYSSINSVSIPALSDVIPVAQPQLPSTSEGPVDSGVDTSVATPSNVRTSNDTRRHNDLLTIKMALDSYKAAKGSYPVSHSFANLSLSNNLLSKALVPNYLITLPTDPVSGWWYGYKSDGHTFTLSARFENIYDAEVTNVDGIYLHFVWSWK